MDEVLYFLKVVILLSLTFFIYFIPAIVAHKKKHRQSTSILILNLFLGWTLIGWVLALVWATLKEKS
jgi:hypothetical protein